MRDLEKHVDLVSKPETKQKIKFNIFEKEEKQKLKNRAQSNVSQKIVDEDLSME